ncbi:MAG: DUF11 domain-containing protein, partial [Elusimicrobia bacterium]|nr:DUF11 domain-containing protein [Elusimicrobiota bacterium]
GSLLSNRLSRRDRDSIKIIGHRTIGFWMTSRRIIGLSALALACLLAGCRRKAPPVPLRTTALSRAWRNPLIMLGPSGQVHPGQLLHYTVQFENQSDTTAYDTYVTDVLSPALNSGTLSVSGFTAINFITRTTTAKTWPYKFDRRTRTLSVMTGAVSAGEGVRMTISVRLKSNVRPGTAMPNYASIYFPTAGRMKTTNCIASVVPIPTALVYIGSTTVPVGGSPIFNARLTSGGRPVPGEKVDYSVGSATASAITDRKGNAAAWIFKPFYLDPGTYSLTVKFPGDGFYYLASSRKASLRVRKGRVLIDAPVATASYPGTVKLNVKVHGNARWPLALRSNPSKTIVLEAREKGKWAILGRSVLSGMQAAFSFPMFKPEQQDTPLRAYFAGDIDYDPAASRDGVLITQENTPAAVTIFSPKRGAYHRGGYIRAQFTIKDSLVPKPRYKAVFQSLTDVARIPVKNGEAVPVSRFLPGKWVLTVTASNWYGSIVVNSPVFTIAAH